VRVRTGAEPCEESFHPREPSRTLRACAIAGNRAYSLYMMMMKRIALLAALLLLAGGRLRAGAELTLEDGMVISGASVERTKEGVYLLTRTDGDVVTIPVELVKKLHLTSDDDPIATGMKEAGPETLVGPPIQAPRAKEQLASFGRPPARFQPGSVDTQWTPQSGLGPDVTEFNPVQWFKAPVNVSWTPTSDFRTSTDVTEFNPVQWYRGPIDPTWHPTNGFRPSTTWFTKLP
jgi:hypothetical protein